MQEPVVVFDEKNTIQSEEEACELFCEQIRQGLERIREGRVFSIEEAWEEINRI